MTLPFVCLFIWLLLCCWADISRLGRLRILFWHFQRDTVITGQNNKTLLLISSDECMDVTSCLLSPRCVGMCVLCSMRYWKWLPFNFYLYRQIWWMIYILHSHSGTPPPLLQRQSGTEHILHYDSGSTDVWVNHSRLSPLLTDELSLCNCRSYPVSQR